MIDPGKALLERRERYESEHPDEYFIKPRQSRTGDWECWRSGGDQDDEMVSHHAELPRLLDFLDALYRPKVP